MRVIKWLERGSKYPYKWSLLINGEQFAGGSAEDTAARELMIERAKARALKEAYNVKIIPAR